VKPARQRFQAILELVAGEGEVSISRLSEQLKVSEMTIRRDLAALDGEGAIRRVRGGALPAASGSFEPPFAARSKLRADEKRRIAVAVAALVSDGETIILDGGTTATAIAAELVQREVTVCTASLRVAEAFKGSTSVRLMVSGGIVRPGEGCLIGPAALRIFEDYRFDMYVMTVSAVHVRSGFTEWNLDDTAVKRAALEAASRCIVACDSSKFGKTAFGRICGLERADMIVTDAAIRADERSSLRSVGVELRVA
jgi:DeoR/GlpR family transcriptional regulator of sugar metabolism